MVAAYGSNGTATAVGVVRVYWAAEHVPGVEIEFGHNPKLVHRLSNWEIPALIDSPLKGSHHKYRLSEDRYMLAPLAAGGTPSMPQTVAADTKAT